MAFSLHSHGRSLPLFWGRLPAMFRLHSISNFYSFYSRIPHIGCFTGLLLHTVFFKHSHMCVSDYRAWVTQADLFSHASVHVGNEAVYIVALESGRNCRLCTFSSLLLFAWSKSAFSGAKKEYMRKLRPWLHHSITCTSRRPQKTKCFWVFRSMNCARRSTDYRLSH